MPDWEFAHIWVLWTLLIIPLLTAFHILRYWKRQPSVSFSASNYLPAQGFIASKLVHIPFILRMLAIGALIVALARPQSSSSWQDVKTEGIDIVVAMDISSSMLARDFEPNRLEASKEVAQEFILNRPNDRIGLVVYAGESFTQCPLTTDHDKLINLFQDLEFGLIENGTAIGMGLANAVNRLKESDAKSKVVILLTDGENTAGNIPPITAAEIASSFGVKVYTIGVGTKGMAPMPAQDYFGRITYVNEEVNIDEKTLKSIAKITNGKYFRATDNESLSSIYEEIDQLEKTVIEETQFEKKNEEFLIITLVGLALLLIEFLMKKLVFKNPIADV